jgi:hypothetical protein
MNDRELNKLAEIKCQKVVDGITNAQYRDDGRFVEYDIEPELKAIIKNMCEVSFIVGYKTKERESKKKETLYNWNDPTIPAWVEYIAIDQTGHKYGYELKPDEKTAERFLAYGRLIHFGIFDVSDWENSLERRPKKLKH